MTKEIVLVDNGGCYSDYGVKGFIIVNKKDKDKVAGIIDEAYNEYQRLNDDARRAYQESNYQIKKFPVDETIIRKFCELNGMKYVTDFDSVSFNW